MLGIAIIAMLVLWLIVIILSIWIPFVIFRKKNWKVAVITAFGGFMLTFGFWVIKWNLESMAAQKEAKEMCKQAGVTIYVQPEKWKEMVGGEEAWKELGYNSELIKYLDNKENRLIPKFITFEGNKYTVSYKYNNRIVSYSTNLYSKNRRSALSSVLYYDIVTNTVLYKDNSMISSEVSLNNGFSMLFFRNVKCKIQKSKSPFHDFIYHVQN